jgi:hypothetical protein
VAKRPRFSRWRRHPNVYRFGEKDRPAPKLEPQRVTLYLPWELLDAAEVQAAQAGGATLQEYCTKLLGEAIEAERVRAQVASIEAQRGRLEGLQEIAEDPEYLAEWSAQVQAQSRDRVAPVRHESPAEPAPVAEAAGTVEPAPPGALEPAVAVPVPESTPSPAPSSGGGRFSPSAEVVLRHAALAGEEGPSFLASLRRGESVPVAEIAELARALHLLEAESRDATALDRRLVYALHRLAFEAQVLHTDAWPGAFDEWTVDTLRAVQEAVDRILSGQDIRYYTPGS